MLLDAATAVMRRAEDGTATLQDILGESGLSTRAFYRHFDSKAALLCVVQLRDADRAAARMTRRMAGATDPWQAVLAWVDEMAGIVFDRRRARRIAWLAAEITQAGAHERNRALLAATMCAPLLATLHAGLADSSMPNVHPAEDAATIFAICVDALQHASSGRFGWDRAATVEHVTRYARVVCPTS